MLDYAGRTPLMNATVGGVGGTVELVLARKDANPDCRCRRDQSLLLPAAKRGAGMWSPWRIDAQGVCLFPAPAKTTEMLHLTASPC